MTTYHLTTGTANTASVQWTITMTTAPPPDDEGLAGVREPRRPVPNPPCLSAVKEPDGTWYVPGPDPAEWAQAGHGISAGP
jgi:hypothetical protein